MNLLGGFCLNLTIDNEFQALIPQLTDKEYQNLEESILNEGCRDSLVLWNEIIIDGHNRYKICNKHNLKYATIGRDFNSRNDVCIWIIQNQLGRRNLPHFARAELGIKLKHFSKKKV